MFQRLIILAAVTVVLMGGTAQASTVTIISNYVVARVNSEATVLYDSAVTSIPTSETVTIVDGGSSNKTEINFSVSASQTTLSYDFAHARAGIENSFAQSHNSSMYFSVEEGTIYELSGFYNVIDVGSPGLVSFYAELYDVTTGDTLFKNYQESLGTYGERFNLGTLGGDRGFDELAGSLAGDLIAGHSYTWAWEAYIQALPNGGKGATAVGNFTLTIGGPSVVPLPAAFPLFLSGLFGLGIVGWRKRRKIKLDA
jgi:hypothetical protein